MNEEYKEIETINQEEKIVGAKNVNNDSNDMYEYDRDIFNIGKLLETYEAFHNFLEEAEPEASIECFEYIVTYMREIPLSETIFEKFLDTDIIVDLVDYTDMFDDNFEIVLDSLHCVHTLVMKNSVFRLQFVENGCFLRIIQILIENKYSNEINAVVLQIIECLYAEPLSFDILDTKGFFSLIDNLSKNSESPEILLNLASIVDLSLHYLENEKRDFFELAMYFFERLKELPDDFPFYDLMERITGGFLNFTSSTNEDIIWLIDNNIVAFCLNDGDGFPPTVQTRLIDFLRMIFNYLPKVIVRNVLPEQIEMEEKLKKAADEVQVDRIETILSRAIDNNDRALIISCIRLLESIVQHSDDFFMRIYESSCFNIIVSLLIESDYKIRSSVIGFLYESSDNLTTTVVSSFINDDIVNVLESFLSSKFDISEKVYQLCLRFYAIVDEGSDISDKLHEIIEDNDPKEK